jgi:hypothetical protein
MVLVMLPLSPRDAVNHGSFHFLVGFQNTEPDPVSYPDSRVERGAERHNALKENHWRRSSGKSRNLENGVLFGVQHGGRSTELAAHVVYTIAF